MKTKHTSILWVLLITICILLAMSHSFYSGNNMVKRYAPLMEAALEVKLKAAIAHLWFEEIISGDQFVDIEVVWQHIDQAEWYANVMLEGGKDTNSVFIPLQDPTLRQKVGQTISGIHAFRSIAEKRWAEQSQSHVGSHIDQLFDRTFEKFLESAESVVVSQKVAMNQELARFSRVQSGLIICVAFLGLLLGWLLQRYENRRENDIQALQESQKLLAKTQRMALIGSWSQDFITSTMQWTQEARRILEVDFANNNPSFDLFLNHAHPDDLDFVKQSIVGNNSYDITYRLRFEKGRIKHVNLRCQTSCDKNGNALMSVGSIQDITEQKQSEEALRRVQKMDSIGQLTGGIAHDFNNILAIILGNVGLLKHQHDSKENIEKRVLTIEKSARRAAVLTKQLLGLSRHQSAEIVAVNINQAIDQMMDLISHSLTPQIEVSLKLSENLWSTEIDPGEFQDALLNLIINARDAMSGRGHLTLETVNQTLDEAYCSLKPYANPGRYIKLSVSDTGGGIPLDLQSRVFEPFFTTKEMGKGTGLGLSMVYSFVKRSGGHINIYSELGMGTTFNIYLPQSKQQPQEKIDIQQEEIPRGNETILAVDDEMGILEVARASLEALGYQVFTASSGQQALEVIQNEPTIELLFSDVLMPGGMNGYELAEQVTQINPKIKVLLTSGYTEKTIAHKGLNLFRANVLSKPYTSVDLAQRVRQTLVSKNH